MLLEGIIIQGRELPDGGGGCGQVQSCWSGAAPASDEQGTWALSAAYADDPGWEGCLRPGRMGENWTCWSNRLHSTTQCL